MKYFDEKGSLNEWFLMEFKSQLTSKKRKSTAESAMLAAIECCQDELHTSETRIRSARDRKALRIRVRELESRLDITQSIISGMEAKARDAQLSAGLFIDAVKAKVFGSKGNENGR